MRRPDASFQDVHRAWNAISDREGKKESKSKGNYTPPEIILDDVAMQFAVLSREQALTRTHAKFLPAVDAGWIVLPTDDREELDLPAPVAGKAPPMVLVSGPGGALELKVREDKALPRRVALLADSDADFLGVHATSNTGILPVEVPRLPPDERLLVRDTSTTAPGADAFRSFFFTPPARRGPPRVTRCRTCARCRRSSHSESFPQLSSFFTISREHRRLRSVVCFVRGFRLRAPSSIAGFSPSWR